MKVLLDDNKIQLQAENAQDRAYIDQWIGKKDIDIKYTKDKDEKLLNMEIVKNGNT